MRRVCIVEDRRECFLCNVILFNSYFVTRNCTTIITHGRDCPMAHCERIRERNHEISEFIDLLPVLLTEMLNPSGCIFVLSLTAGPVSNHDAAEVNVEFLNF